MGKRRFLAGVLAVMTVGVLDAALKWKAVHTFEIPDTESLSFFLAFSLHKNPGIAFDIPMPFFLILPLTILLCGLFGGYFGLHALQKNRYEEALACLAITVGALGNVIDRIINGFTTDYLILFRTSAINLSDVLIVIGMAAFLWYHEVNPSSRTI